MSLIQKLSQLNADTKRIAAAWMRQNMRGQPQLLFVWGISSAYVGDIVYDKFKPYGEQQIEYTDNHQSACVISTERMSSPSCHGSYQVSTNETGNNEAIFLTKLLYMLVYMHMIVSLHRLGGLEIKGEQLCQSH